MLPRAEISVTPMMDVMLVLLMIFMFMVPAIITAVDLPDAANADPRPPERDEIVLRIDRSGTYTIETPDVWGSAWARSPSHVVTIDELRRGLGGLYRGRTKDRVLYLKADTELPFGAVQRAIEIARESGVRVVAVLTERQPVRIATARP
jgi:biopolymer transport protein TolR